MAIDPLVMLLWFVPVMLNFPLSCPQALLPSRYDLNDGEHFYHVCGAAWQKVEHVGKWFI